MIEWCKENPGYTFLIIWIALDALVKIAQALGGKGA